MLRIALSKTWLLFFFILLVFFVSTLNWFIYQGSRLTDEVHYQENSPSVRLIQTVKHLSREGNFRTKEFYELEKDLRQYAIESGAGCYSQDAFAQGQDGELYPKHAPIAAILALPFYMAFGSYGLLLFSVFCLAIVVFCAATLFPVDNRAKEGARQETKDKTPRWASLFWWGSTFVFFFGTEIVSHVAEGTLVENIFVFDADGFSHDILAAALLIGGVYYLLRVPFMGAMLLALSLGIRPSHLLLMPLTFIPFVSAELSARRVLETALGLILGITPILLLNWNFWGTPLETSYQNLVYVCPVGFRPELHGIGFSLDVFCADWYAKLFSPRNGLIRYNPALLFVFFAAVLFSSDRSKDVTRRTWSEWLSTPVSDRFKVNFAQYLIIFCTNIAYLFYIFSYEHWAASHLGNRFLLGTSFLLIACALLSVFTILRRRFLLPFE